MKEQPHSEPSFRFDDFKKWMDTQKEDVGSLSRPSKSSRFNEMVGKSVYPKLSGKRLATRMTVEEGDLAELVKDFRKNGGKVIRVDEQILIIEVGGGSFGIPKYFVTLAY